MYCLIEKACLFLQDGDFALYMPGCEVMSISDGDATAAVVLAKRRVDSLTSGRDDSGL